MKQSKRDRYGIKTMKPGESRLVIGKTRDQFRRVLVSYYKRHPELLQHVFDWKIVNGDLEVKRVI